MSQPGWSLDLTPFQVAGFCYVIVILSQHYHSGASLLIQHKDLLDVLEWQDDPDTHVQFVKAIADKLNCGVLNEDGNPLPTPHNIYVE